MLLDPSIDTAAAFSDGSVTGSIAKAGSFRGAALIVPTGVDAGLIAVALRGRGIFVEGPIPVPAVWRQRRRRMKLSVNFIAKGKCYRAGDNIPDAEVPAFVARYMMANADADADSAGNAQGLRQQRANADQRTYEPEPVRTRQGVSAKPQRAKPPASQRYVRRGVAFVPVSDSIELGPGEKLYVREKGRVPPRFVRVGRVREPETAI